MPSDMVLEPSEWNLPIDQSVQIAGPVAGPVGCVPPPRKRERFGSKAVRETIKKYQPEVGLHGHIHESRGAQKIGRTMCLNPGSDYSADLLRGAIVDFDANGSYIDFLLTSG